jgi:hypothetical protein
MPVLAFERPVGVKADVQELEYISVLHQTSREIRKDLSIQGKMSVRSVNGLMWKYYSESDALDDGVSLVPVYPRTDPLSALLVLRMVLLLLLLMYADEDIRLFLLSRYGIDVTVDEVRSAILSGMGGGSYDAEVLDAMELVAILMIPALRKTDAFRRNESIPKDILMPPEGLLEKVLHMVLTDVSVVDEYLWI